MNNEKKVTVSGGGMGFLGTLQIVFIVLKLCGVIDWSWWLVFIPAMFSVALFIIVAIIVCVIYNNIR